MATGSRALGESPPLLSSRGGSQELAPAFQWMEVSDARQDRQLGVREPAGHVLRVVHGDDGVSVAMPQADWEIDLLERQAGRPCPDPVVVSHPGRTRAGGLEEDRAHR